MENNTRAQMPNPFMEPQLNDIVSVIETRNIHFAKAFSRDYCLEIIDLLKKVESYDRLMKVPQDNLYIRITICSEGGSILALFSLLEQIEHMKEIGYTVHTHSNFAASCGFILHCSGNYKTCSEFAVLLNHQGSSMTRGTVMEMRTDLRFTEMLENKINDYLRKNTRMSEEEIQRPARTNLDIWYSADEAMTIGVVDKIINL
jgi:ATP-dependent protease ClpP protease subunit